MCYVLMAFLINEIDFLTDLTNPIKVFRPFMHCIISIVLVNCPKCNFNLVSSYNYDNYKQPPSESRVRTPHASLFIIAYGAWGGSFLCKSRRRWDNPQSAGLNVRHSCSRSFPTVYPSAADVINIHNFGKNNRAKFMESFPL